MNKKILIIFILAGLIAFGSGIGTLAYFSAAVESKDNVYELGKLAFDDGKLNDVTYLDLGKMFEVSKMRPGVEHETKSITLGHRGGDHIKMRLAIKADWKVEDAEGKEVGKIDDFKIKPYLACGTWYANGSINHEQRFEPDYMSIDKFEGWLNTQFQNINNKSGLLEQNQAVILRCKIKLDEKSGNEYQGAKLKADVVITGYQKGMPKEAIYK